MGICFRSRGFLFLIGLSVLLIAGVGNNVRAESPSSVQRSVPVLYSSDLFHPHEDPDDHYDLATLFALEEFDIRGVILDMGEIQVRKKGLPPLEQMMEIAGRKVPYAVGLNRKLRDRTDKILDAPAEFQGGVELILNALRASKEKVTIITVGSCRDVAVAWNREPDLMREKVKAVYVNAGRGPKDENQCEFNVYYDRLAYLRLLEADLPIYWAPCFGLEGYNTYYSASLDEVQKGCSPRLRNYFVYCLSHSNEPALPFLDSAPRPLPRLRNGQGQDMTHLKDFWCLGTFLHAAGRSVYRTPEGDWEAVQPAEARRRGWGERNETPFAFQPIRLGSEEPVKPLAPDSDRKTGEIRAACVDTRQDWVAPHSESPDGVPDVRVRVWGLDPAKAVVSVEIANRGGERWDLKGEGPTGRIVAEKTDTAVDYGFTPSHPFSLSLDSFQYRLEVRYADGTSVHTEFSEPFFGEADLKVQLDAENAGKYVFHKTSAEDVYEKVMASCLYHVFKGLETGKS
ncbi:MAG TPA: nucleoside hydrolase [Candidatus Sumerlaeota bacterium]|nr:nucleoside hydrolase [Candidatus Sumerlaeota bacterium]